MLCAKMEEQAQLVPLAKAEEIAVKAVREVEAMYRSELEYALAQNVRLQELLEERN